MSDTHDRRISEFSGHAGLVQPEPHVPSAAEMARIERNVLDDQLDSVEESKARGGARKVGSDG